MRRDHTRVTTWLGIGVIMVFVQILLGGITRLTGSGLSITHWDIVTGTIPPLNALQWEGAFELYKATPQYQQINQGISLSQFKFIFFWEYVHRLWARSMGFVFLFPFFFFLLRKSLSKATLIRLALVIGFAVLAAIFGWIMVASGLIERPWVNAYKLTIHLALGIALFISLFYTWISERGYPKMEISKSQKNTLGFLFFICAVQVVLGGMVSGMKAALMYPTWPLMHSSWIPPILFDSSHWNMDNFLLYDRSGFMPALVQFLHRNTAYLIGIITLFFAGLWIRKKSKDSLWFIYILLGIIVVQGFLGVMTLIGSVGSIPVFFGALHQGVGILLLTFLFYLNKRTMTTK